MKNILNTIVLLEIISVMCVRHTASLKNNYRGRPITKLFNTPQKKDNDSETPDRRPAAADVATPRPREVGGACRIQVLATARTQETVGGPNGAKRSEFRRRYPPAGAKSSSMHKIAKAPESPLQRSGGPYILKSKCQRWKSKKTAGTGWPWQFSVMRSNP